MCFHAESIVLPSYYQLHSRFVVYTGCCSTEIQSMPLTPSEGLNSGQQKQIMKKIMKKRKYHHWSFTNEKRVALGTQDTLSKPQFWILSPCPLLPWLQDHSSQFGLSPFNFVMLPKWDGTSFALTVMLTQLHNQQDQTLGLPVNQIDLNENIYLFHLDQHSQLGLIRKLCPEDYLQGKGMRMFTSRWANSPKINVIRVHLSVSFQLSPLIFPILVARSGMASVRKWMVTTYLNI